MRNWRRWLIWSAVAVVVLGSIVYGLLPQPVWVDTATVRKGTLTVSVRDEGHTRVIDRYVISAPVDGYLMRVQHDVGDPVKRGQVLAQLEPLRATVLDPRDRAQAKARIAAAEASLAAAKQNAEAAKADADVAKSDYQRKVKLRETRFISEDVLDRAHAEVERTAATLRSARFAVDVARYELDAAKSVLDYSAASDKGATPERVAITSPVDGAILGIYRKSEGVVQRGQSLIEVGNPAALEVAVDVLSIDAVQIKPGDRVLLHQWGGAKPLDAVVRRVEPAGFKKVSALGVDEQRVWVISDITTPHSVWQRLGDGYRVEAEFILSEHPDAVIVPEGSLFRYHDGWALYAVDGGRARLTPVTVGARNGLEAQITGGIEPGAVVIAHPDDQIADGVRVKSRAGG